MSEQTLRELTIPDVLIVHLADNMEELYSQISDQPERFVVVLDEEDVPLYLSTGQEIKCKMPRSPDWPALADFAARLPEALLVDENVTLDQAMVFFSTLSTLEPQPQGLVVMGDDGVIGVLSYDALNDFYNAEIVPQLQESAQIVRADGAVTVARASFRCRRHPRCSYTKTVSQVDRPPLCKIAAHGHMVLVK
jgi:hypothetical protein